MVMAPAMISDGHFKSLQTSVPEGPDKKGAVSPYAPFLSHPTLPFCFLFPKLTLIKIDFETRNPATSSYWCFLGAAPERDQNL